MVEDVHAPSAPINWCLCTCGQALLSYNQTQVQCYIQNHKTMFVFKENILFTILSSVT